MSAGWVDLRETWPARSVWGHLGELILVGSHGGQTCSGDCDPCVTPLNHPDVKPLLVLDPDDADQMRELSSRVGLLLDGQPATQRLTAAVRAMLPKPTPVRPPEPTGLGAVVEDDKAQRWIRVDWTLPWCFANPAISPVTGNATHGRHVAWDELAGVKVLSEGVTP